MAVLLVVLFHSGVSGLSGGFVGVDVFFVISGFVITGVLLAGAGLDRPDLHPRLLRPTVPSDHPGRHPGDHRHCDPRLLASWVSGAGAPTATDGRWAAVFLANFHFIATGTNYLASEAPPSPLQNFWSLAVEEQFYVVYPTLFLLVAAAKGLTFRVRLAIGLVAVIVRLARLLDRRHPQQLRGRLLLPVHPGLGAGPRCPGGGRPPRGC